MTPTKEGIEKLITSLGGKFSTELGIDLAAGDSGEIFKWFLASKLFAARIGTNIAIKTYREFEKENVLTPKKILSTGWDGLVRILDAEGYVRYDFSTATKLLEIMQDLMAEYHGDLIKLHQKAKDEKDLEGRLKGLGKGIGDVTVNIFLRELRETWPKVNPELSPLGLLAAQRLKLIRQNKDALSALKDVWKKNSSTGKDFCDFEAALIRLGKDYCKKLKWQSCPMGPDCGCKKISGDRRREAGE